MQTFFATIRNRRRLQDTLSRSNGIGVPIVGTHIGLDSLNPVHGEQVFISDNDLENGRIRYKNYKGRQFAKKDGPSMPRIC